MVVMSGCQSVQDSRYCARFTTCFFFLSLSPPQCDPRKVRLSEPTGKGAAKRQQKGLTLAPVPPPTVGTVDPRQYLTGGKSIRQAQLDFLAAKLAGAAEDFVKLPKRRRDGSFTRGGSLREKNRYADVLPYDDNLVSLQNSTDGTDYVNASYVTFPTLSGGRSPYYFICTQGPTPQTVDDHW